MEKSKQIKINQYMKERALKIANYVLNNKVTVREAAKHFYVSKSTVHKDLTDRLSIINPELYKKVQLHLDYQKSTRHIRGGEATRIRFKKLNDEMSEEYVLT